MTRQLLLMHQGASKRDSSDGLRDKAKRRAQRMGIWLARHDLIPDRIICSSDPCAIVTTAKLAKAMGFSVQNIVAETNLIQALEALPHDQQRILLVGDHTELQPLMNENESIRHGDLIILDKNGEVQRYIDAKALPKGFPFPNVHHAELRARPAYYYRQSSVIPYRIDNHGIEILLVASSRGHHWVVPKGIHEPGMSAADSAAKEAWEEAGVVGVVAPEPLGKYRYTKWKNSCDVTVFAMHITQELDEQDWQESHRGRRWCRPEQAIAMLHQPLLKPLIQQLVQSTQ